MAIEAGHNCPIWHNFRAAHLACVGRSTLPRAYARAGPSDITDGVVTLSQIERKLPTTANAESWNFNGLACAPTDQIWLISLNVTTPLPVHRLP
jgi:hypothetical protein